MPLDADTQFEMGQAYKAITEQMGPSPQLVAFVNFDKAMFENCGLESMDIITQHEQILAEIDAADSAPEQEMSADDLIFEDGNELFQLSEQIDQLAGAHDVIQMFGVSPAAVGMMHATGLLAGTSLETIAIEDFNSSGPEDYQSQMAMETLLDTIKKKATAWAARVVDYLGRISSISFKDISNKITSTTNALVAKVSNAAHNVGKTIKAHPYKSALIAVGGIVTAAAMITFIGQRLQVGVDANNNAIEHIWEEATRKYKFAGTDANFPSIMPIDDRERNSIIRNVHSTYAAKNAIKGIDGIRDHRRWNDAFKHAYMTATQPELGTWQELGWTQQNIVNLSNKIKPLFDQVGHAVSTFTSGAMKYVSSMKDSAATEALQIPGVSKKSSHRIITSLFWMVYRLVKTHIGGGFHWIASILLRLLGH